MTWAKNMPPTQRVAARTWRMSGKIMIEPFYPTAISAVTSALPQLPQAPTKRIELVEKTKHHGDRLLLDRQIMPQFGDEMNPGDIDIMKHIMTALALGPHPARGDPMLELGGIDIANGPDDGIEIHHGVPIPRRGS